MTYTCENCGKVFERKSPFKTAEILCNSCIISKRKKEEFQKPEKKEKFLKSSRDTCKKKYGYSSVAQVPEVKAKHAHKGGFAIPEYQEKIQKAAHSREAMEKKIQTNFERYGADHYMRSEIGYEAFQNKILEKTGYRNPMQNPEIAFTNHAMGYFYNEIHFDSSWELAYYIWLIDHGKKFIYHPKYYMDYVDNSGVSRVYQPDFLIEGTFYEIKGDQFFNENGEPWDCYNKKYWWEKYNKLKENNVIILREKEVREYLKYVKDVYGKDYLKQFKIKFNDYRNSKKGKVE